MKFVFAKSLMKNKLLIKLNYIISITSDQNLIIYDSMNSYYQNASNCSYVFKFDGSDVIFNSKMQIIHFLSLKI